MTKVDIYSGFLGAGKTTLIKKMIAEGYKGQKLVLIENEFGEIGIDGGFLQDAGINITEMNSGCICCSLVGDFGKALTKVINEYHPDRIIIEPSGVGKLSDVIGAVNKVTGPDVTLGYTVAVVDAGKVKVYTKNFGEFYNNQVETASTIILSRTDSIPQAKLDAAVEILRQHNSVATVITTPWGELTGEQLISAMEGKASLAAELARLESERLEAEEDEHEHHHHHHDDEDDEDEHAHHHHHHDEDDEDEHEHHHHHHHHHGHDADEVFISWGEETHRKFTKAEIEHILQALEDAETYGIILRAKGYVANAEGEKWIHFDYVPGEPDIRDGGAMVTGRICVIGSKLNEEAVAKLFGVEKQ